VESGGGNGRQEAASKSQERLQCHRAYSCPVQVSQSLSEFAAGSGFSCSLKWFCFFFFFFALLIVFSRPKWLSFVLLRARGCLNPAYSVRFIEQNFH